MLRELIFLEVRGLLISPGCIFSGCIRNDRMYLHWKEPEISGECISGTDRMRCHSGSSGNICFSEEWGTGQEKRTGAAMQSFVNRRNFSIREAGKSPAGQLRTASQRIGSRLSGSILRRSQAGMWLPGFRSGG